ncbi:MAG TPA: hypothetical protein VKA21_12545, partial [Candidatus Binatia bacterium]|nr:hypothetical protein [Candidatus Binatia bacterium]
MKTVLFCAGLVAFVASSTPSYAQLSGSSSSNTGSSCTGANNADGFCGSSTQVLTNTGTTFQSRYAWNVNADVGIFSTRDTSGTARHNLNFTATAVGGYRLDITQSRVGALGRSSDASGCDGQSHIGAVSANSNVAFAGGSTLTSAAPGLDINNGGGNANTSISQGGSAQIFNFSGGVGQSHALSFTFTGSARSNSCEAAVRLGQQNGTTTGCTDTCEYAGNPSRTLSSDGHFITVSFTSLCGNGTIESAAGEQCDPPTASGCCTSQCLFASSSTVCRASAGVCDPAENCTGSASTCPGNSFSGTSTVCRPSAGVCDVAENCTGSGAA